MAHLPDPLSYYEKIGLSVLSCLLVGLCGYSLHFYLVQLNEAQNNPSNSVSLFRDAEGILIPDVYIGYNNIDGVSFRCDVYRIGFPDSPCPSFLESYSNITFYQQGTELNVQTKYWIRFSFDSMRLRSNNIDNVILFINASGVGVPIQDLMPQVILFQRTEQEPEPYRLEEIINRAYSITPNGGIHLMTYSLSFFQPLREDSYYLVSQLYNGFLMYDPFMTESLISLAPNSPLVTVNREFVPIGAFNVFSSIWSIISLCVLIVSGLFTRQMPKIHLYFMYRNELSYAMHFLSCRPCRKEAQEVPLDSIAV